jgi:3-deoxy-D-manno-octulosonic-acid transferase
MRSVWQLFYDILWHPFLAGWLLWQLLGRKNKEMRRAAAERLAIYPPFSWKTRPVIWFHASSLGEVLSLIPLMQKLREKFPHSQVLSVSTVRGEGVARQKSGAEAVLYLPFDISYLVKRALQRIAPDMVVIFETEIWPNLFWQCARRHVPLVVVSGRISPRSFRRYRLARPFFASVLRAAYFLMQSEEDARRIGEMGAPAERVQVCGDIKFDGLRTQLDDKDIAWLHNTFAMSHPLLVAGSTHAGEEEAIFATYATLKSEWPDLSLILAPRHLQRLKDVTALLDARALPYRLRSTLLSPEPASIIILDTYGELGKIYYLADVVFVGGTLVPVGGHNIAEPAALGKPVLFGPHIANCQKQASVFLEQKGAAMVYSTDELTVRVRELLADPARAMRMGERARDVVIANQGAMARCLDELARLAKR